MTKLWLSNHLQAPPAGCALSARSSGAPPVDLAPFASVGVTTQLLSGPLRSQHLEAFVAAQFSQPADPRYVSLAALRAMSHHPMVYLAERTISGILRRPDLYFVRHNDRRIVRETEEWLWPLLPGLLGAAARAFSYGSVPVVLDWTVGDLRIEVARDDGSVRQKALPDHLHYGRVHEVWPGDAQILVDGADLVAVEVGKRRYLAERAHLFRWDPEFDSWIGQSARRRAWRSYLNGLSTEQLQRRYLERSVDSPRVAYAPTGTVSDGGEEESSLAHLGQVLSGLQGSGTIALPSNTDAHGKRKYELTTLEIPDRKDVWQQALDRDDAGVLKAFLVPPSLGGVEDLAATGAKTLDGMLKEFIQDLAIFAATNLTQLVRVVHEKNHDLRKVPPPEVLAFEVPSSSRKLLLEVLRVVNAANHGQAAADVVDVPALLDQLGVPLRTAPKQKDAGEVAQPTGESGGAARGRPRDVTSERERRREDARTVEGEDAVGAVDEAEAA